MKFATLSLVVEITALQERGLLNLCLSTKYRRAVQGFFYYRRRYVLILLAPSLIVCMYLNNCNVARDDLKHIWRHKLDMHLSTSEYH